jgi:probable HAF family extracellular repeat protein
MAILRFPVVLIPAFLGICVLAVPALGSWLVIEVPMQPTWSGDIELRDINDNGEACGMGNYVINTSSTAFRFDVATETVTELPHLYSPDPITLVTAINNNGVICGYSHNASGDSQAVYYVGTTLNTIPYPPDANTSSDLRAYNINDDGVIVGYFWSTAGERTAFYFQGGSSYSLDAQIRAAGLTGLQIADGINNLDVICGVADDTSGITTAWTYDINSGAAAVTVIGKIGTDNCSAVAINDSGQTIGRAKNDPFDKYRAVTYDGSWHFVDPLIDEYQWGQDINNQGRMVGSTNTSADRWAWYSDGYGDGSMIPVSLADWSRLSFNAINDDDWIVAYGRTTTSGSDERACIIRPRPGDIDHDGIIDLTDFATFAVCYMGSGVTVPPPSCSAEEFERSDLDEDGDVDLSDFSTFATNFGL